MAVIAEEQETSTGIRPSELAGIDRSAKILIGEWLVGKAGYDDGREFYGRRIRSLSFEAKHYLASNRAADLAWEERERRRCIESPIYLTTQYGSVVPEQGPPIPFDLWPEQAEALQVMVDELRVIVLKARQLGLTWLALHLAIWLMAFNRLTPKAKVLVLSKIGTDADALIERARDLVARLPRFLRPNEKRRWADSNSRLVLTTGAEMRSLMGTPAAARSFTATMTILDEFGFYRNGQAGATWTSALPGLGEHGKAVVISTGNGESGDGAAYAQLWQQAKDEGTLTPVFLADTVNPARRAEGWRDSKRREFLTLEDFLSEHPLTEDDAFQGAGSFKVYPRSGVEAALRIGAALDEHLYELAEQGVEWGIDWGDFQTFAVYAIGLPGGGAYIFDEVVIAHTEPAKASEQIVYRDPAGLAGAAFVRSAADSNPIGNNRTFARVLREAHNAQPDRFPSKHETVEFGRYKQAGGQRQQTGKRKPGANTVAYIRALLDAAEEFRGDPLEASGLLAVSPRCQTYAAQMMNLERDVETGKVRKPSLDPRHVERGDHGPDASIALLAQRAKAWRSEVGS